MGGQLQGVGVSLWRATRARLLVQLGPAHTHAHSHTHTSVSRTGELPVSSGFPWDPCVRTLFYGCRNPSDGTGQQRREKGAPHPPDLSLQLPRI